MLACGTFLSLTAGKCKLFSSIVKWAKYLTSDDSLLVLLLLFIHLNRLLILFKFFQILRDIYDFTSNHNAILDLRRGQTEERGLKHLSSHGRRRERVR